MARKETGIVVVNASYSGNLVNIPLPTTNTVYTNTINISDANNRNVGAAFKLNGVLNSANAIATLEGGFSPPAIEGAQSPIFVAIQTQAMTAVGTWNYLALLSGAVNTVVPYVRFKVVSATTNTSSTVNIKLIKQVSG